MGKMNSSQREFEVEVMKFVQNKIGINIEQQIQGDGRLEGGDYICTSSYAYIGCGMRTNYNAIMQLMDKDLMSGKIVAVVKDQLHWQHQMHLDTYFNVIGKYKVVMGTNRLRHNNDVNQVLVDEWHHVFNEETQKQSQVLKLENVDFEKQLHDNKMIVIEINEEDTMNLGTNFLTIKEDHIVCADGVSEDFKRKMRENQVKVD